MRFSDAEDGFVSKTTIEVWITTLENTLQMEHDFDEDKIQRLQSKNQERSAALADIARFRECMASLEGIEQYGFTPLVMHHVARAWLWRFNGKHMQDEETALSFLDAIVAGNTK